MTGSMVSIGECMVEMAPTQDGLYSRGFAGDTFNTAWYLARLMPEGTTVDYYTAVGTDGLSDRMIAFMGDGGVGTSHIRRLSDRTVGLYMIELANGERSFIYWRGTSAAKRLASDRAALAEALAGRSLVLFSGITMAIIDAEDRDAFLSALQTARGNGATIVFDPNMRARLWPDAQTMRDTITAAASVADIVLPSFDEDQREFGDTDPQATIARYRALGVGCVVVKNGAGTVYAQDGEEAATYEPVAVKTVVDTTAAGDSFNAGFIAARLGGAGLRTSIERGSRLAAQVVQKRGALVDIAD
ncbi:sugar kinase [Ciceribacter sp. L1K23]|uniref:sugar kinase n=1 Tax=Ciceribacter sp. L1K23 TaxID=2820276 RepID=UPI001B836CAE|nr:sugar kinase [Ciceribacter sp. L1K23]MBR0558020.1 sugar kinase [Ciceribacter sp. L1K23]